MADNAIAVSDMDLTCWYINERRVIELVGLGAVGHGLNDAEKVSIYANIQKIARQSVLKESLMEWMKATKPPSLGELIIKESVAPGIIFTHYSNWFFKGSKEAFKAQERGVQAPHAMAYAKLDTLKSGTRIECRFYAEHLTSISSWGELSGQRPMFVLGLITAVEGDLIQAIPYVIGNPAPGWGRQASLIGLGWLNKLEIFPEQIDTFSSIRSFSIPKSKKSLEQLRDIPENNIKHAFAEIIEEPTVPKDWGGERSDLYTTRLEINGKRISSALAFKGPAKFKPMEMSDLGKNGDQVDRLFSEPAEFLLLQHCHEIRPSVRNTMRAYAQRVGNLRLFCLIDGYETLRILKAYGKCGL